LKVTQNFMDEEIPKIVAAQLWDFVSTKIVAWCVKIVARFCAEGENHKRFFQCIFGF